MLYEKEEVKHIIKDIDLLKAKLSSFYQDNIATNNNLEIIDTDNFEDLFYTGKVENTTSCQAFDYSNKNLRQGLTGYMELPWIRLVGVREKGKKEYKARRMIKLGFENKEPIIFVEPHYGDARFEEEIMKVIREKARLMGYMVIVGNNGKNI